MSDISIIVFAIIDLIVIIITILIDLHDEKNE